MKSGSERVMQSGALHTVLPAQPRSAQVHTPLWEEALAACAGGGPPHGRRMEDAIDCAEIATLTQLDVRDVEEIVRIHCHNDRDETNRAVAQFFDGVGPFIEEASNAWKSGGSKNKSRKVRARPRRASPRALGLALSLNPACRPPLPIPSPKPL